MDELSDFRKKDYSVNTLYSSVPRILSGIVYVFRLG